ncbi:Methylcrotonoyl-CoA carboxylase subunit alpha, mitochondrial [Coelomomyces lativittatus]|nr:Methylcrotonoyl-CoA carboxylase subunit alpha, mitochondrial [Coelomomyces lativittatus]KAJ1518412.1 Methylcrotonoyl-CoA carboxylase subunit alpha, mitochondrial [Coelomomyces lativittatus]
MGSKSQSKKIMSESKIPVVPGYHGEVQDPEVLQKKAKNIGYPVLIKAIRGGGGKGMRIVESEDKFMEALQSSKREAMKSYGDDRVLVEKYLKNPRHIEVQVFADTMGNTVHLFERDCSVQRRHQKIIEEAPAPFVDEALREKLGSTAVNAAKAVGYVGAGTVEFILDPSTRSFYFMEMNTRLQVEHPVTEMITQTDLVAWQLYVASGHALPKTQTELQLKGWAFEARVYAENPNHDFLPDTGKLVFFSPPHTDEVRFECGVRQNDSITVYYDPMIAKVVVWANERTTALHKLQRALHHFQVVGLQTNLGFLKTLASHPSFIQGEVHTGFIQQHQATLLPTKRSPDLDAWMCVCLGWLSSESLLTSLRLNHSKHVACHFLFEGQHPVHANAYITSSSITLEFPGHPTLHLHPDQVNWDPHTFKLNVDGGDRKVVSQLVRNGTRWTVFGNTFDQHEFELPLPSYMSQATSSIEDTFSVRTPMPCRVALIHVQPNSEVTKGQPLMVLESMKMEHTLYAPQNGKIEAVLVKVDELVKENVEVIRFYHEHKDQPAQKGDEIREGK